MAAAARSKRSRDSTAAESRASAAWNAEHEVRRDRGGVLGSDAGDRGLRGGGLGEEQSAATAGTNAQETQTLGHRGTHPCAFTARACDARRLALHGAILVILAADVNGPFVRPRQRRRLGRR